MYAVVCHVNIVTGRGMRSLQDSAAPLLLPDWSCLTRSSVLRLILLITSIIGDNCVDCLVEDFVYAGHLLTAALHVARSHLVCYRHSLLLSHWCQALRFEEINASTFRSKIRLEADEDKRRVRAKVKNLGVPLGKD
jgi:hypothetical protein